MDASKYSRVDIALHNEEARTLGQIIKLAHVHLETAPAQHIRRVPIEKRAGLVGPDLVRVREMIAELAKATGTELPKVEPRGPVVAALVIIE